MGEADIFIVIYFVQLLFLVAKIFGGSEASWLVIFSPVLFPLFLVATFTVLLLPFYVSSKVMDFIKQKY